MDLPAQISDATFKNLFGNAWKEGKEAAGPNRVSGRRTTDATRSSAFRITVRGSTCLCRQTLWAFFSNCIGTLSLKASRHWLGNRPADHLAARRVWAEAEVEKGAPSFYAGETYDEGPVSR
jgi:hypothetical protein